MADPRIADLGLEAVRADREQARQRSVRDKRACEMWELISGTPLPETRLFEDEQGNTWELGLVATVRLVQKGAQDG